MKKFLVLLLILSSFLFANSLDEIRKSGTLRVGVFGGQPPFSTLRDGNFEGFEVEFAKKISNDLFNGKEAKIEFSEVLASERVEALRNNKVDMVIATLTITQERSKVIDFTSPYFAVNLGILTRVEDNIHTLADIRNIRKPILVESGSTGEAYFKKHGVSTIECEKVSICYKTLKENKDVVGFANDNLIVLAYPVVDKSVEVNIKNIGRTDFLGIGVQKGNKELLNFLNDELIKLSKEGFFKNSFDNFINPFYKGMAEKKYFLLDDIYSLLY